MQAKCISEVHFLETGVPQSANRFERTSYLCWGMTQLTPAITGYDHCIHSTVDSDIIVFAHSQAMFHKIYKIWDFKN